jgi:hypothetical protein
MALPYAGISQTDVWVNEKLVEGSTDIVIPAELPAHWKCHV